MVDIIDKDEKPVVDPNKTSVNLSYHIKPELKIFLDRAIKNRIQKKDKDYVLLIDGYEGCISGDTEIQVNRNKLGRRYTIKRLYNHYNKNPDGIIQKNKSFDLSKPSFIRAFNGKEIRLHKLKNVMYSGKKQLYELKLKDGRMIKATANHKFLTREGWKPLDKLKDKEEIMCDTLTTNRKQRKRVKLYDVAFRVYYHPDYLKNKKRVEIPKLIYESRLNNLSLLEFLDILLNEPEKSRKLKFIDYNKYHIHHKDGCHYNNSIDNLELLNITEHLKYHGINGYANFSQGVPVFIEIKKIIKIGIEDTYDIECEEPYHNFVANGIVIHNSGKSVFAQQIGRYVDPSLGLKNVCMTADEFKQSIIHAEKSQCVIYDEAVTGLSSGESITRIGRLLKSMMMQMRQKNLFVIVILPSVFEFNKYAILSRARSFFHIYEKEDKMGYWVGYNRKNMRLLYLRGKKTYSYKVRSNFYGRFYGKYAVNEKLYRQKKEDALALMDDVDGKGGESKMQYQRKIFLINWYLSLKKLQNTTQVEFSDALIKAGHQISSAHLCKMIAEVRKEGKILTIGG